MVGSLGASVLVVGIIEGIAEAIALIVKVFSGYWSDVCAAAQAAGRARLRPRGGHQARVSAGARRSSGSSRRASPTASARAFAARRAMR